MSTLAASNLDEPPPKTNQPPLQSPSLFSSLPNDIILDILARVPKRYYPIVSCVSKNFQILVRSPEIQKTRYLLRKDSLYISFYTFVSQNTRFWFILRKMEKNPTGNHFAPVDFSFLPHPDCPSVIAVGPEIFFIGGSRYNYSSSLWIFDSRSEKLRQGPNMQVELNCITTVGLVGGKIYVIGYDRHKIHAEFFDLKTQTWKPAPIPEKGVDTWMCPENNNIVLDRKVCTLTVDHISCYDTRDGSCERIDEFSNEECWSPGVCVIDNVLYFYNRKLGLMWYDFKLSQWRMVNGLDHLNKDRPAALAEYYGKLAYIWTKWDSVVGSETQEIWCRMIVLDKSEVGIHGTAEPSKLLGFTPSSYALQKCLSVSD